MQQLEIKYFFPLTEQIDLDLDYTPCKEFEAEKRRQWAKSSVTITSGQGLTIGAGGDGATWATVNTTPTFQFKPANDAVGYWQFTSELQVWRKERPNWLHQKMTKFFFGWEWKDK